MKTPANSHQAKQSKNDKEINSRNKKAGERFPRL